LTKEAKNGSLSVFDANYTNFLSSIIYFTKLDRKDSNGRLIPAHKNQIFAKGFKLVFGNQFSIDLTDPVEQEKKKLQSSLLINIIILGI
jgi:hypothetical protein